MKDTTFGFIGLGLIGGSIAKGIKRLPGCPNHGIYAHPRKTGAGTGGRHCRRNPGRHWRTFTGMRHHLSLHPGRIQCPVSDTDPSVLKARALISDVGSTKEDIHRVVYQSWYGGMCLWADILWPVLKRPDMRTLPTIF